MIQDYVKKELDDKNRLVYFKSGRWIVHLFIWLCICLFSSFDNANGPSGFGYVLYNVVFGQGLYMIWYFCYCRYLVPGYFKQGKYRSFWLILIAALLLLPAASLLIRYLVDPLMPAAFREADALTWSNYTESLVSNSLGTFFILSFVLYLMELAEGIGTYRSVNSEIVTRLAAERLLLRTRMQPDFVMRSLDGIAALAAQQSPAAPDALVGFSDILRYRLYQNQAKSPVLEELEQLQQLFRFQKSVMTDGDRCELAIVGDPVGKSIPAFTLINIAEALFATFDGSKSWSLLFYLLMEETSLELTIELNADNETVIPALANLQDSLAAIFNRDCTFTIEQEANNRRINICIPTTPL